MNVFTEAELGYLKAERRLARIATVGADGMPHVAPVGWRLTDGDTVIEVGGLDPARTKKFRDVARSGKAALVVDDIASVNPWHVRGIEVRGRAEAVGGEHAAIRIHPTRIVSWGLGVERSARDVVAG